MSGESPKEAERGSQKWVQILINQYQDRIYIDLKKELELKEGETICWKSPLKDENYREYRDEKFLEVLGLKDLTGELKKFWPDRGPRWDALAKTNKGKIILLEAKSHIAEINSPKTGASSDTSRKKIQKALDKTRWYLKCKAEDQWDNCFYQYTNRLAHLYFLNEKTNRKAYLVYILFLNDKSHDSDNVFCPRTPSEWKAAIELLEKHLGIRSRHALSDYVKHVFIDVRELSS